MLFSSHCIKSVRIRSYPDPHFPAFEMNTERYGVSLRIQSECGKMQTRITPNVNTFHEVCRSYSDDYFVNYSLNIITFCVNIVEDIVCQVGFFLF